MSKFDINEYKAKLKIPLITPMLDDKVDEAVKYLRYQRMTDEKINSIDWMNPINDVKEVENIFVSTIRRYFYNLPIKREKALRMADYETVQYIPENFVGLPKQVIELALGSVHTVLTEHGRHLFKPEDLDYVTEESKVHLIPQDDGYEEEEGPYGGAFRSERDYMKWRHGKL